MWFRWLRRLVARLIDRRPPWAGPAQDPFAGVRHPRTRGPAGRQSAVAVMEPEPPAAIEARGRHWPASPGRRRRR